MIVQGSLQSMLTCMAPRIKTWLWRWRPGPLSAERIVQNPVITFLTLTCQP